MQGEKKKVLSIDGPLNSRGVTPKKNWEGREKKSGGSLCTKKEKGKGGKESSLQGGEEEPSFLSGKRKPADGQKTLPKKKGEGLHKFYPPQKKKRFPIWRKEGVIDNFFSTINEIPSSSK